MLIDKKGILLFLSLCFSSAYCIDVIDEMLKLKFKILGQNQIELRPEIKNRLNKHFHV